MATGLEDMVHMIVMQAQARLQQFYGADKATAQNSTDVAKIMGLFQETSAVLTKTVKTVTKKTAKTLKTVFFQLPWDTLVPVQLRIYRLYRLYCLEKNDLKYDPIKLSIQN